MKAKIAKWGNSIGLRLPKPLAQDLGLTPGREVDLRQNGSQVVIETSAGNSGNRIPSYRLEDLLAQIKPGQKPPRVEDWSAVETPWPDDDWGDVAPSEKEWEAMKRRARAKSGTRKRRA